MSASAYETVLGSSKTARRVPVFNLSVSPWLDPLRFAVQVATQGGSREGYILFPVFSRRRFVLAG